MQAMPCASANHGWLVSSSVSVILVYPPSYSFCLACPCRPTKERYLLDAVMATLRGDGSVLMPIDTGALVAG
jgi:hypothetical protein